MRWVRSILARVGELLSTLVNPASRRTLIDCNPAEGVDALAALSGEADCKVFWWGADATKAFVYHFDEKEPIEIEVVWDI